MRAGRPRSQDSPGRGRPGSMRSYVLSVHKKWRTVSAPGASPQKYPECGRHRFVGHHGEVVKAIRTPSPAPLFPLALLRDEIGRADSGGVSLERPARFPFLETNGAAIR